MAKATKFDAADYLDNPDVIAEYLSEAFLTGDEKFIADAMGNVARAKGMASVAIETGLNRESLYKALSPQGHPELGTTMKVLDSLDMEIVVRPKAAA
jgi:probable addiction module antidote protein